MERLLSERGRPLHSASELGVWFKPNKLQWGCNGAKHLRIHMIITCELQETGCRNYTSSFEKHALQHASSMPREASDGKGGITYLPRLQRRVVGSNNIRLQGVYKLYHCHHVQDSLKSVFSWIALLLLLFVISQILGDRLHVK
jgi:hypothetical protein